MKKTLVLLAVLLASKTVVFAQFDPANLYIGLVGNYTTYKGDLQKSTFGPQLRVGYDFSERFTGYAGYTHGLPIKTSSQITYQTDQQSVSVNSTIKTNLSTFSINASYCIVGDNYESTFALYGGAGAGLVMATSSEKPDGTPPTTYYVSDQLEKEKVSGFTINLNLGAHYRINNFAPFVDAGLALPANRVNNVEVSNYIPAHFMVNAGVKIFFGTSGY